MLLWFRMWCVGFSPSNFSGAVSVPCRHPWVSRGHCSWYKARGLSNGRRAVHANAALISMMTAHAPNLPRLIRKRMRPMDRIRRRWGQSVRPMNRVRAFNSTANIIPQRMETSWWIFCHEWKLWNNLIFLWTFYVNWKLHSSWTWSFFNLSPHH